MDSEHQLPEASVGRIEYQVWIRVPGNQAVEPGWLRELLQHTSKLIRAQRPSDIVNISKCHTRPYHQPRYASGCGREQL